MVAVVSFQITAFFFAYKGGHYQVLRFLGGAALIGTIPFTLKKFIHFNNSTKHALRVKLIELQCIVLGLALFLKKLNQYADNEVIPSFVDRKSTSIACVGMHCDWEFALPHVLRLLYEVLVSVFVPTMLIDLYQESYHHIRTLNSELEEQEIQLAARLEQSNINVLAEQMLNQQVCRRDSTTNKILEYNPVEGWYAISNVNIVSRIICNEHVQSFVPQHESLLAFHMCRLSTIHAAEPVSALRRFNTTWPPLVNFIIESFLFPSMVKRKILNDVRLHWVKHLNDEGWHRQTQLYAAVEDLDEVATLYLLMQNGIEVNKGGIPRHAETYTGVDYYETSLDFIEELFRKHRCYLKWQSHQKTLQDQQNSIMSEICALWICTTLARFDKFICRILMMPNNLSRKVLDAEHNGGMNANWELMPLKLAKCEKIRKMLLQHGAKTSVSL